MKLRMLVLTMCLSLAVTVTGRAEVKPASIFSNGMVLQREAPVKVWGTAAARENVEIIFNGQSVRAKAGKDGRWTAVLKPMPAGGPYSMTIRGKTNAVTCDDVMVGEVWLCSGQSNMEWSVSQSMNAPQEIAAADYPMIRCFTVGHDMSPMPKSELSGSWAVCSPETVGNFTAVGYFFARKLWNELDVPVGIINSSWGGTDIEVWTSPESFEALPAKVRRPYDMTVRDALFSDEGKQRLEQYNKDFENDPAIEAGWYKMDPANLAEWGVMQAPMPWSRTSLAQADGHVWFRYEIDLPASADGKQGVISLGPIDDNEITFINGVKVGNINGHNIPRIYNIDKGLLREGRNVVTVRVTDTGHEGGMCGQPEDLWLDAGGKKYPLAGEWKYKGSVVSTDYGVVVQYNPNMYYSTLYNSMINPIVDYRIKGAIWYQGENNAWNAHSYRTLFPNMITNWRQKWGYEFPFYWVQLADYMAEAMEPRESQWAELREAQTMTLSLPQAGQAVIIDIGDAADIHPRNKQDVGLRLALNALAKDYGRTDIIYSAPVYSSVDFSGSRAVVSFDAMGSELVVRNKYGYVEGFAVAGEDRVFHWAKAWIEDGKVVVQSDAVRKPVAVRYAWSDNPRANLFNTEGLPVGPFRTDDWPGITK